MSAEEKRRRDEEKERRFIGTTFVYRGEYPRRGGASDAPVERVPGGARQLDSTAGIKEAYAT